MAATAGGAATLPTARAENASQTGGITPVAWMPSKDIDAGAWVRVGHRLGAMTRCSQWWLGDWIRYGTKRWGEKYKEASRITGYDGHTLRNIAYVAGQVGVSRRRDNLTWSHHAEVCALKVEEQEHWLDLAASEKMSVADLRIELRSVRRIKRDVGEDSANDAGENPKTITCPECRHRFAVALP